MQSAEAPIAASARPLKLLFVRDTLAICGPGKTILNTWRTIDRTKFQLTIAATRPPAGRRNLLLEAAERHKADVVPLPIGPGIDPIAVWRLVSLLRDRKIDILQTHDAQTRRIGVIAAALTGTQHVTSVHGWIFNARKERAAKWLDAKLIRRAHAVVVVSDRLRAELEAAGVPPDRITVLRNGILLDDYAQAAAAASFRRELGLLERHRVVAIVGRLSEEKGHEVFLQAARVVAERCPEARFLVVGDGPLEGALRTRTRELGLDSRVLFAGHRSNVAEVYAATDVLAISSFTEGIPNVLLEAFAFGKPAVATAVGGVPEVIQDGETGWLIPAGDHEALAAGLLALLLNDEARHRMGTAARAAVESRFSFLSRTRALEEFYVRARRQRPADGRVR